jgi:hypothetical protein
MKESSHYTEEDFQNYLDNNFAGDVKFFEYHLQQCEYCSKIFETYSLVWSFTKNDLQIKGLEIDLAYSVANKVYAVKERKTFERVMYAIFTGLGSVCLYFCFKDLVSSLMPVPFILLTIHLGLFLWVNYKEVRTVERKFALHHGKTE